MSDPNSHPKPIFERLTRANDDLRLENWRETRCEPDLVLPIQFNDLIRRRAGIDGEVRLALAVLEDAIRTYVKCASPRPRRGAKKLLQEVSDWFASGATNPFSFEYICELLNMHSDSLRGRLHLLTIDDFPTKQTHAVGRRHLVRPRKPHRRESRSREAPATRPANTLARSPDSANLAASIEQKD